MPKRIIFLNVFRCPEILCWRCLDVHVISGNKRDAYLIKYFTNCLQVLKSNYNFAP